MKIILFGGVMLTLLTTVLFAQTYVPPGDVSGVWDSTGTPYLVLGDITIPTDSTLSIGPGVVVDFQGVYAFYVNGIIQAIGTETDSIIFTGPTTSSPRWRGMRFDNAQDGSQLTYCTIMHGRDVVGAPFDVGGGLYLVNSNPNINHCTVTNCYANDGGAIYIAGGAPIITNSRIVMNGAGLAAITTSAYGGGIHCVNASPEITGNYIADNTAHGATLFTNPTHARGGGIYLSNCGGLVSYNTIINNVADISGYSGEARGGGICAYNSWTEIINNTICLNEATWGLNPTQGGGIDLYSSPSAVVKNNIIQGNTYGGIHFESSTTASITYNDLFDNEGGDFIGDVPAGLGTITGTNANGDPCDDYYNIFLNALFVEPSMGYWNLQAASPCIDAGDPASPLDPDGTVADMGAHFFNQSPVVPEPSPVIPQQHRLLSAYPNPFNATTVFPFEIASSGNVTLSVYNLLGQRVTTLLKRSLSPGTFRVSWDAGSSPSGIYFVQLEIGGTKQVQKVILQK
jgi:parallel beta-helix repeat protein